MNSKARKYDYVVIGISAVIFAIIFVLSQIDQEGFVAALNSVVNFLCGNLGWFLNLATLLCIVFALYFMFSKYGKIKLGGKDAKPEFKTFTWWGPCRCALVWVWESCSSRQRKSLNIPSVRRSVRDLRLEATAP